MIEIVPNWHPIWVHLAIGLLSMGTVFYVLGLVGRSGSWGDSALAAGRWNLIAGAIFAAIAVWTGLMAAGSVAHDDPAHANMMVHKQWAYATLAIFGVVALWLLARLKKAGGSALLAILAVIGFGALAVTGYEGAENVFEHGLGVQRLPDVGGHDHDAHDHGSGSAEQGRTAEQAQDGHDDHDHGEASSSSAAGQDDGHAHDEAASSADHHDGGSSDHPHDESPAEQPSSGEEEHDHSTHDHGDEAPSGGAMEPSVDTGELADQAQALSDAIASGDETRLRELLAEDVLIFEGGGAERSFEEYAGHHMGSDMAFLGAVDRTVLERRAFEGQGMAAVATRSRLSGSLDDKEIDLVSSETLVFERRNGQWKIVHIHWASGG